MSQQSLFGRATVNTHPIGTRVRVAILDPDGFVPGGTERLNGATGVIVRDRWADPREVGEIVPPVKQLVRFDVPVPTTETHKIPSENHWFTPENLVAL